MMFQMRAWMMFQRCFLAVEMPPRITPNRNALRPQDNDPRSRRGWRLDAGSRLCAPSAHPVSCPEARAGFVSWAAFSGHRSSVACRCSGCSGQAAVQARQAGSSKLQPRPRSDRLSAEFQVHHGSSNHIMVHRIIRIISRDSRESPNATLENRLTRPLSTKIQAVSSAGLPDLPRYLKSRSPWTSVAWAVTNIIQLFYFIVDKQTDLGLLWLTRKRIWALDNIAL